MEKDIIKSKKCNHNINEKDCDIIIDRKNRNLVYPEVFYGVCKICQEPISFIKVKDIFLQV